MRVFVLLSKIIFNENKRQKLSYNLGKEKQS